MENETSQETNTNQEPVTPTEDSKLPEENESNVGRPLKFKTVEELQKKIDEYFDSCFEDKWFDEDDRDEDGNRTFDTTGKFKKKPVKKKVQIKPFTVTGLALALDTSRKVLCEYEEKDEFSNTLKKAKQKCENHAEECLFGNNVAGVIFNLKNNYNWKDQNQTQLTGDKENPLIVNVIRKNGNNDTP